MLLLTLIAAAQLVVSVLILGALTSDAAGRATEQLLAEQRIRAMQRETVHAMFRTANVSPDDVEPMGRTRS